MILKESGVWIYPSGRQVCDLRSTAGRAEYGRRIAAMHERQKGICCLSGHIEGCPGPLRLFEAVFEHQDGRGHGGGNQDDRIEVMKDGKLIWQNGAAHFVCNGLKGSRRIDYNTALQARAGVTS